MIQFNSALHGELLFAAAAANSRPGVEPIVANYRAHWQLSLDGNQPAAIRDHHRSEARRLQSDLFFLLASLDCLGIIFQTDRSSDV